MYTSSFIAPKNCRAVLESGEIKSGIYDLKLANGITIQAYCDQVTDGGGWTVLQRRVDNSFSFDVDWEMYENGFGIKSGSFWLGLKSIHVLTNDQAVSLRVDLKDVSVCFYFIKTKRYD